mmetsp:Transcript_7606/g.11518  ORF Transcript_7606/g.11518 Transcript_7606/m.11518 type:complete len:155 (-) Transcript_7606:365-829(-)
MVVKLFLLISGGILIATPSTFLPIARGVGFSLGKATALIRQGQLELSKIVNEADDLRATRQVFKESLDDISSIRTELRSTTNFSNLFKENTTSIPQQKQEEKETRIISSPTQQETTPRTQQFDSLSTNRLILELEKVKQNEQHTTKENMDNKNL